MKISVIGVGAMGGAMVQGFMKGDMFACSDITASNPSADALDEFSGTGLMSLPTTGRPPHWQILYALS